MLKSIPYATNLIFCTRCDSIVAHTIPMNLTRTMIMNVSLATIARVTQRCYIRPRTAGRNVYIYFRNVYIYLHHSSMMRKPNVAVCNMKGKFRTTRQTEDDAMNRYYSDHARQHDKAYPCPVAGGKSRSKRCKMVCRFHPSYQEYEPP